MDSAGLLALVKAGMASADVRSQAVAKMVLDRCVGAVDNFGIEIPRPLSLRPGDAWMWEKGQHELRLRCGGLRELQPDAVRSHHRAWTLAMRRDDSIPNDENIQIAGHEADSLTKDAQARLRKLVQDSGPEALFWASEALLAALTHQAQFGVFAPGSPLSQPSTLWAGIELARCKLGFDCGPNSLRLLNLCTGAAICGDDLESGIYAALSSDADRATAKAQAALITSALASRRPADLGLSAEQLAVRPDESSRSSATQAPR